MREYIILYLVKGVGAFIRFLPLPVALWIGRKMGTLAYFFDVKHKTQAYSNLKMAFADSKSPEEIKSITKRLFQHFGQNFIELLRLPLLKSAKREQYVEFEGEQHTADALKEGKGLIFLAMHFGSWEMVNFACSTLSRPYNVLVKAQDKYSKLDDLLNDYRAFTGSSVIRRGMGTREMIKSLHNNEIIGIVVDQGGRDGVLVPFFNRQASLSSGALRIGLKMGVPICFSVIYRTEGGKHKLVVHPPMKLDSTGDVEKDVVNNLAKITKLMEKHICERPWEYMWIYKIWKYSNEANVVVLSDGKVGHQRQSEAVAKIAQKMLLEREINAHVKLIPIQFRSKLRSKLFAALSLFIPAKVFWLRVQCLKMALTRECFEKVVLTRADYVISCGSSIAGINHFVAKEHNAKSIVVLKPGMLNFQKFHLVILPQHDVTDSTNVPKKVAVTKAALNLIDEAYLTDQKNKLLNRYSHLKSRYKTKIGVFIGGDSKNVFLSEDQIKILISQIKQAAHDLEADVLITTSRRTPKPIEEMLHREFHKDPRCALLILANRENIPEAVGGILGLSDLIVVSGDSISMVSEAASSGKYTVAFTPQKKDVLVMGSNKFNTFLEQLSLQGFILSTSVKDIGEAIFRLAKNKVPIKKIDDQKIIEEALKYLI